MPCRIALGVCLFVAGAAASADLAKVDRSITAEPAYRSKSPGYALVVIGPEARDRVWLVKDGEDLHVLTDKHVRLSPTRQRATDDERNYDLAELPLNGRKHANLQVRVVPLRRWMTGTYARRPELKAAIEKEPDAEALSLGLDAELPHLKAAGRVTVFAGCMDLNGALLLTRRASEARVVHVGGPLEVSFQLSRPALLRGRPNRVDVAVGSPGLGAGTFAALAYEDTIPEEVRPRLAISFPLARPGGAPVQAAFDLPERC